MQADHNTLKEQFKRHLRPDEILSLGVDLPAGADHYRAFVGPPFNYDMIGVLQLVFLIDLGLREYSSVLDIGCGSLRLGRLLIPFLMPNRYFGVEPNRKILDDGILHNLGAPAESNPLLSLKQPRFAINENFDFSFVQGTVDFIMAQSIASHTGPRETKKLLASIAGTMSQTSLAIVTYIRCEDPAKSNTIDGWFYPTCVTYTDQAFGLMAKEVGLVAYRSNWPLANKHAIGLITTQTPCILTKGNWRPSMAQLAASLGGTSIERID